MTLNEGSISLVQFNHMLQFGLRVVTVLNNIQGTMRPLPVLISVKNRCTALRFIYWAQTTFIRNNSIVIHSIVSINSLSCTTQIENLKMLTHRRSTVIDNVTRSYIVTLLKCSLLVVNRYKKKKLQLNK